MISSNQEKQNEIWGSPGMCLPILFCILKGLGCRISQEQDYIQDCGSQKEEQNGIVTLILLGLFFFLALPPSLWDLSSPTCTLPTPGEFPNINISYQQLLFN